MELDSALVQRRLFLFSVSHRLTLSFGDVYPRAKVVDFLVDVVTARVMQKRRAHAMVRDAIAMAAAPCPNLALPLMPVTYHVVSQLHCQHACYMHHATHVVPSVSIATVTVRCQRFLACLHFFVMRMSKCSWRD